MPTIVEFSEHSYTKDDMTDPQKRSQLSKQRSSNSKKPTTRNNSKFDVINEEEKSATAFSLSSDGEANGTSPNLLKDSKFMELDNDQLRDKGKKQPVILLTALSASQDNEVPATEQLRFTPVKMKKRESMRSENYGFKKSTTMKSRELNNRSSTKDIEEGIANILNNNILE